MTKDHTYSPSKRVRFEWRLTDGEFAMTATVWDESGLRSERHIITSGQAIEEAAALVPDDEKAQRMLAIWREWHLNHLTAGSPAQEAWLKANPIEYTYPESHYEVASAKLAEAGLNPDTSFVRPDDLSANVKTDGGYRYGSAWLKRELPAEIIAEIESWG